jgi:Xaa-Pro dipeptidase
MASRQAAARAFMRQHGLAVLFLYVADRAPEVEYLCEWPGTREALLVMPLEHEPRLFVQLFNHLPNAARIASVPTAWGGVDLAQTTADYVKSMGLGEASVGVIGQLPFQHYLRLRALLPKMELKDSTRPWRMLRTVKSDEEIERFRIAADYTDRAMDALQEALKTGVTEHQLADTIEHAYRPLGGTLGIHFMSSMPVDQPTTGLPGQIQTGRTLTRGDVLITEISAGYGAYTGQIHRTYFLGIEPTPAWKRLHEVAVGTYERIEHELRDGADLAAVLDAAEYVHDCGLSIYDDLLHGANQYPPILKTRRTSHSNPAEFTFRENMVVVIQPNVVTDAADPHMGLQFGETVRITQTGVERLHRLPREYFVVACA